MDITEADAEMRAAHTAIGGLIARCSLLDYRVSQFIARWFCAHEKQKFLSYTLRAMPFAGLGYHSPNMEISQAQRMARSAHHAGSIDLEKCSQLSPGVAAAKPICAQGQVSAARGQESADAFRDGSHIVGGGHHWALPAGQLLVHKRCGRVMPRHGQSLLQLTVTGQLAPAGDAEHFGGDHRAVAARPRP